jgi:hypothetical protein
MEGATAVVWMALAWRMEREAERRFVVGWVVKEVVERLGKIKIVRRRRERR